MYHPYFENIIKSDYFLLHSYLTPWSRLLTLILGLLQHLSNSSTHFCFYLAQSIFNMIKRLFLLKFKSNCDSTQKPAINTVLAIYHCITFTLKYGFQQNFLNWLSWICVLTSLSGHLSRECWILTDSDWDWCHLKVWLGWTFQIALPQGCQEILMIDLELS